MTTLRERMRARGELLLKHAPILTLGCTMVSALSLTILAGSTALSTVLRISEMGRSTSVENTSGSFESLEIKIGELSLKATGRTTMEVLTILKKTSLPLAGRTLEGKFSQSTPLRDL